MSSRKSGVAFESSASGGFTLFELMVVLVIISVTIGLVAPLGYKVLKSAASYIAKLDDGSFKRKAIFQAFLLDRDCEVLYGKGAASLICQDKTILRRDMSEEFKGLKISNKGFAWDRE